MHFLCLHGIGTNSKILELQTAALRYHLGEGHTYDFVEGSVSWPAPQDIEAAYGPQEQSFAYFDPASVDTVQEALSALDGYVADQGPFDGVLAFSQGAALAATLIIQDITTKLQRVEPVFRCALFMSATLPFDPGALSQGTLQLLAPKAGGPRIPMFTAHVWGSNDTEYPGMSEGVKDLCSPENRSVYVHTGGHVIPSGAQSDDFSGMLRVVKECVRLAMLR